MTSSNFLQDIKVGHLRAKLAENKQEIKSAKELRYRIFVEELGAKANQAKEDSDIFDDVCDHLLVIDDKNKIVVGTYRLMRSSIGKKFGKFYSQAEYDIDILLNLPGETLELGRSCVDKNYRNRSTMQLLWQGIATYVVHYNIEVMFGCASFPGTDLIKLKDKLSYLYHFHLAPPYIRPKALKEKYVNMDIVDKSEIVKNKVVVSLPPLMKGYLRLGGFVGDGAVLDNDYNTTDVCVVVKTDLVTERYVNRYAVTKK